jgi:putative phage repressor
MKSIKRIKQYIDFKGFTNSSFEKEIGVSNGYIGTQLKRNADLGEGILNKIINNCLDLNPEWLLTGKGQMLNTKGDVDINQSIIGDGNIMTGNNSSNISNNSNQSRMKKLEEKIRELEKIIEEQKITIKEKDKALNNLIELWHKNKE